MSSKSCANSFPGGECRLDDRGAAVVEAAIVFPILLGLLLGMITGGLAYNRNNALNNAAREGARYGATLPVGGDLLDWLDRVAAVSRGATAGELDGTGAAGAVCVAYVHPAGVTAQDRTTSMRDSGGTRTVEVGRSCFDDGRTASERRVQVVLQRNSRIETLVVSRDLTLSARTAVRFERAP